MSDRATPTPTPTYLDWGALGRSGNWRYLLGTILIVIIWFGGQAVVQFALAPVLGVTFNADGTVTSSGQATYLIFNLASFLPFFIATPFIVKVLHKRPGLTVATPFSRINWGVFGKGVLWWSVAMLIPLIPTIALRPGDFRFNADWSSLAAVALVVVVFLIWQTSAEELFFRGYLMQWFGKKKWRNPIFLGILSGLLFAAPHLGNPEVREASGIEFLWGFLAYFMSGFGWAFASVRSGTIELALGAHFINNLVNILFITVETSALGATSLVIDGAPSITEAGITSVVTTVLFIVFVWRVRGSGTPRPTPQQEAVAEPVAAE